MIWVYVWIIAFVISGAIGALWWLFNIDVNVEFDEKEDKLDEEIDVWEDVDD